MALIYTTHQSYSGLLPTYTASSVRVNSSASNTNSIALSVEYKYPATLTTGTATSDTVTTIESNSYGQSTRQSGSYTGSLYSTSTDSSSGYTHTTSRRNVTTLTGAGATQNAVATATGSTKFSSTNLCTQDTWKGTESNEAGTSVTGLFGGTNTTSYSNKLSGSQTYEDSIASKTTTQSEVESQYATGAVTGTYTDFVKVCSTTTKSTNETDSASTKLVSSMASYEAISYSANSILYSETITSSKTKTTTTSDTQTGFCNSNMATATELILAPGDVWLFSSDAAGESLLSSALYTTRASDAGQFNITHTPCVDFINLTCRTASTKTRDTNETDTVSTTWEIGKVTLTTGETTNLGWNIYSLNSNLQWQLTQTTAQKGVTNELVVHESENTYALAALSSPYIVTTSVGLFPYYTTWSENTNTFSSIVGYISLTHEATTLGNPVSYFMTKKSGVGSLQNGVSTEAASYSTSASQTYTSTAGVNSTLKSTYSESLTNYSSTNGSSSTNAGKTVFLGKHTSKSLHVYAGGAISDFAPTLPGGTIGFGGMDSTVSYTSLPVHISITTATAGETFSAYDAGMVTNNLPQKPVANSGVVLVGTGEPCFSIPTNTLATFKWVTSSDWPASDTSTIVSGLQTSSDTYVSSGETLTSTSSASMSMSLSLTSAITEASASAAFVTVRELFGYFDNTMTVLNTGRDIGSGANHADIYDRPRTIYFPAGAYLFTEYPSSHGTSDALTYTTGSTAGWTQTYGLHKRMRIVAQPMYNIYTYEKLGTFADLGNIINTSGTFVDDGDLFI